MPDIDLKTALDMFKTNVNEFAMQRAIGAANEQVQQIKASDLDEQKQRAQLQQLSNGLVSQLAMFGTPATTIAQVAGAIGPQAFGTPQAMAIEGALSGRQDLIEGAAKVNEIEAAPGMARQDDQQDWQSRENELNRRNALAMAGKRANGRNAGHITDSQINKFADSIAMNRTFGTMLTDIDNNPTLVGPANGRVVGRGDVFDKEYGRFKVKSKQLFNQYRSAVTGAGASVGEIKMLEESFPTGKEDIDVYREKVAATVELGQTIMNSRLEVLEASGKDTTKLRELIDGKEKPQGSKRKGRVTTVKVNGTPTKGFMAEDGTFYPGATE